MVKLIQDIKQKILDWIVYYYVRSWYWYNIGSRIQDFREEATGFVNNLNYSKDKTYNMLSKTNRYRWLSKKYMKEIIQTI